MTELTTPATKHRATFQWRGIAITVAAFVLALLAGAILMIVSDPEVAGQFAYLFTAPALPLGAAWGMLEEEYESAVMAKVAKSNGDAVDAKTA